MPVTESPSPLRRAHDALYDLHSCRSWAELEHFALEQVHPLIGANRASWTEFRTEGRIGYNEWSRAHRPIKAHYTPIINEFLGKQHPGITVLDPHQPWDRSWRITDFFSQREFERTELCNEGYRPTECRFQITLQVHCTPYSHTTATFGRNHRDFTDNERDTLDCLLPHFQLVANRLVREQRMMEAYREVSTATADTLPWVSFDQAFFLRNTNRAGLDLLKTCPQFDGLRLPPALAQPLANIGYGKSSIQSCLMIDGVCYRLHGHPTSNPLFRFVSFEAETPETYLQQRQTRAPLTPREQEVAMWARQGKTNPEIGIILGVSPRTVGKHLENIFQKLDIAGRSALMTAR